MMEMRKLKFYFLLLLHIILCNCNLIYAHGHLPQIVTIPGWKGIRNDFWNDLYKQGAIKEFCFEDSCTVRFSSRGMSLAEDTLVVFEEMGGVSFKHFGELRVFSISGNSVLVVTKDSTWVEQYKYSSHESILIDLIKTSQTHLFDQWSEVPYSYYTTPTFKCFVYLFTVKKNNPIQKEWMFDPNFLYYAQKKRDMIKHNIWHPDSLFLMQDDWRFR